MDRNESGCIMPLPKSISVFAVVMMSVNICGAEIVARFASYYDGKQYSFEISTEILESSPSWKESENNPPLPAQVALQRARARLALLFPNAKQWEVSEIVLRVITAQALNRWIYIVRFKPPESNQTIKGAPAGMDIVVMMNGIAINPIVRTIQGR
jgi:hypothetical protein